MRMFNNRAITVRWVRQPVDNTPSEPHDPEDFEKRAEVILHKLEQIGIKVLMGVAVYIALDTLREVAVAKAYRSPEDR